jgi:superfamily II DNA or RNA helicase
MGELQSDRLYGMAIGKNEMSRNLAIWSMDGERVSYGDITLGMAELRGFLKGEVERGQAFLYDELMFGAASVRRLNPKDLVDDLSRAECGWSFVDDHRNSWATKGRALLAHIQDQPSIMATMSSLSPDGKVVWDPIAIRKYEDTVQRFLESLLVSTHMGSGTALRSREIMETRWCNTEVTRNFILHDGLVMLLTRYHKGQQMTRMSRWCVRFLPPAVGEMLVNYLVYVIPLRRYWLKQTTGSEYVSEFLWAKEGKVWKQERLTLCLRSSSALTKLPKLMAGKWRQMTSAIVKKKFSHVKSAAWDLEEDEEKNQVATHLAALHNQSNHTPHTANQDYADTVNFDGCLNDAAIQAYATASATWRSFFDLEVASKHRLSTSSLNDTPLMKRIKEGRPKEKKKWSLTQLEEGIKQLYKDESATWLSDAQKEAMQAVMTNPAQLVVIMATGAGKSLLYMLPAILPGSLVTVLIMPLLALKHDQLDRLRRLGVSHSVWQLGLESNAPLVVVSAEQTALKGFREYLTLLWASGKLGRIVVDEGQLILTASEYRPSLFLLRELREFSTPIVCLSASIPPTQMTLFEERMFLSKPKVLRFSTDRTNISYAVIRLDETGREFREAVASHLAAFRGGIEKEDKIIVYVQRTEEADELAALLGCEAYYAKVGNAEEKLGVMKRWKTMEYQVIVATSAFGAGVDHPHVRLVCHVGSPDGIIDFSQESGRAGRDGRQAVSVVFLNGDWRPADLTGYNSMRDANWKVMQRFLSTSGCRRNVQISYNDGEERRCGHAECDNCKEDG